MKKTILLFLGLCLSSLMQALVLQTAVVTTAGTLYSVVSSYKADVTDLTVTGTIDARDFVTIRDSMPNLVNLDLSGSNIAAYQGTAQSPGSDTYQISGWGYIENMIPYWAFVHETSSTTVTGGSTTLKSIILPNTCTWISYGAFYGCTALSSITLPESLTKIGGKVFFNCTSLSAISIPSAVTTIGDVAFFNCSALTAITVNKSTPPSFSGSNNFSGVNSNCIVYVPSTAVATYQATAIWNTLTIRSINNALSFDGNGNYVDLGPLAPADNFSNGFSFMCWVKFNSFDDWSRIFDFGNGLNSDNLLAGVHTDGSLSFDVFSGTNATPLTTQAILSTGTWTHIAFTVNALGLQTIYINGNIAATGTYNSPKNISRTIGYLGKSEWTGDPFLNGQMDEVSIWNNAITQSQIISAMTSPITNPSSVANLVAYYDFNNGTAGSDNTGVTTLTDLSGSALNGTLNNFALTGTTSNWVAGYDPSVFSQMIALSATTESFDSTSTNSATVQIGTLASWTATSSDSWLHVSPSSGTGFGSVVLTATGNSNGFARSATVTITASGLPSYTINVSQAGISTLSVVSTSGNLYSLLSIDARQSCTKLIVTGEIDARDFVTMRDSLPNLDTLDLSAAKIMAYSGDAGTDTYNWNNSTNYNENAIPQFAFFNEDTYQGSQTLKTILLPKTLTEIGFSAFNEGYNLKGIIIPASVTGIDDQAFSDCNNLSSITFEANSTLTSIGWDAFYYCINLHTITIPASVTTLSDDAFEQCFNLNTITFEANSKLTSIGNGAFIYCQSLSSITIPASVTSISSNAFLYCYNLQTIFAQSKIPVDLSSSNDVFSGVDAFMCKLIVPSGSEALYQAANQWQDFNIIAMNAKIVALGNTMDASAPVIDQASSVLNYNTNGYGNYQYVKFIATETATYTFSSTSNTYPVAYLYDESGNSLNGGYNGFGSNGYQFNFSSDLTKGKLYYLEIYNNWGDNYMFTLNIDGGGLQSFVYTGAGNWDITSNWNWGELPQEQNTVTVKGNLAITQDISVTNFTVSPNASVTVDNGIIMTYNNLTLVNDTTGSASLISDNTSMTATVQEYLKSGRNWYITSPMTASTSNVITAGAGNSLWDFIESKSTWDQIANTSTPLSVMTGYVANNANALDGFISFTEGYLNTGTQTITVNKTGTGEKSGFNLIGNPYPSSVDWSKAALSNMDSTIWYRTQNKSNTYVFDTYNAASGAGTNNNGNADVTQDIAPLQAVWVKVSDNFISGTVTFNNDARIHDANRLKSGKGKNRTVRLQVSNGQNTDETILVFNENASDGVDGFDSPKMFVNNSSVPEMYSIVGKKKMVINGMKSFDSTKVIPLGFTTAKAGTFTISANEITGIEGTAVVLEDTRLHKTQDLTLVPTYTFASDSVNDSTRFVIHLKSGNETTATTIEQQSEINIYSVGNTAIVSTSADNANGTVTVFNLLGQSIASASITGTKTVIELPVGVYFVKAQTATNIETTKLIIE